MEKPSTKQKQIKLPKDMFANPKISMVKKGHNRTTYIAKVDNNRNLEIILLCYVINLLSISNEDKFVVKKENNSKDIGSDNITDITFQNFLHSKGYAFTPKIVYHDIDKGIIVETLVGQEDCKLSDLSDEELDIFAKQLSIIHSLSLNEYYDFCLTSGFNKPSTVSPIDSLNTYGFDRFEIVKKLCQDQKVVSWLKKNLDNNLSYLKKSLSNEKPHLKWGHVSDNMRRSKNNLFFIDWEYAEIGFGTEIPYIKIHSGLSEDKLNYLISRYAFYSKLEKTNIEDEINKYEKIIRINDVVWAAMKWGQAESIEDTQKYKDLTYKRINLAENIL